MYNRQHLDFCFRTVRVLKIYFVYIHINFNETCVTYTHTYTQNRALIIDRWYSFHVRDKKLLKVKMSVADNRKCWEHSGEKRMVTMVVMVIVMMLEKKERGGSVEKF